MAMVIVLIAFIAMSCCGLAPSRQKSAAAGQAVMIKQFNETLIADCPLIIV